MRSSDDEKFLERAIKNNSFISKSEAEKKHILETYQTFMMYRNPVHRLVSGYLSKIDRYPLIGLHQNNPERNWIRKAIYQTTHPQEFKAWMYNGSQTPIHIEFPDYITYWIKTEGIWKDEHFRSSFALCTPCQNRYTYYGKFEDFSNEVVVFNHMIQGNLSHVFKVKKKTQERVSTAPSEYYSQISYEQKVAIIKILALDLGFYYTIFPEEKDSHKIIMGVDYDSAIPSLYV